MAHRFLSGDPVFFSGELYKDSTKFRRRKMRYFRLVDGALYNYRRKGEPPTKAYSVIDGKVTCKENGILLQMSNGNELLLKTDDEQERSAWMTALQKATKRKIGRYYGIHGIIGAGAFAEVRLGYAKTSGQQVAIKIMRKNKRDHELMTAVNCELKFVSRNIRHKSIVSTYDVINTRDTLFIVMEYMEGGMLYDVLAEERMLSEKKAGHVLKSLLEALSFLHQNDIVHRDVKPENVLCSGREWPLTIKLADFGLADVIMEDNFGDKSVRGMYGTPFFVAPEVIRGENYGPGVDIWSCGVLLYNMLSGQLPFEGATLSEVLKRVKSGKVDFPEEQWSSISPEAKKLVRGLLDYDPARRYSAKQALADPWFHLAATRPEKLTGNDMTLLSSKEARDRRSSVAVEDIEHLLREARQVGHTPRKHIPSNRFLGGLRIYRRSMPGHSG
mmetsp:Transcript_331/g.1114  ORF Transcript_331/g.1114 Transcript_331/m.1114 type:complete len:443 (+) Transcript_331:185-1513(+)|eukprot:CAMPEP_0198728200 /NCGR_PEP_ID=MMETSP1475-20131203/7846_1 /TAXON_ID= ORGANISM="Unidentified sp., Strain CCMP1999" /NCGR_SAMPLE_ID=MMETSP1475 /ASSEMBLY_ACC=CAM_ASM_001111 /LENGTH=442 /DNA_ID=CAMNT_0044490501 /DNA_START=105 /DNA_END=1433 /DNA_ORIENTATION=-